MPDLKEFGFKLEELEIGKSGGAEGTSVYGKTDFPKPDHRYRLVLEAPNLSLEESYFWILQFIREDRGFRDIEKLNDVFSASEHSSFFGAAWQRIGINQDKASQFLATIGKMVKELFQLVRELRVLDERLTYYEDSFTRSKSAESAEITLKGIWIDLVEQGSKNPASVYGMARELQFTTLPDLFFSTNPKTVGEIDDIVEKLDFNRKVREVLKRKLRQFMEWKHATFKEIKVKRKFTLKYLRQHYEVIRMYMSWVRPYLKNVKRLSLHDANEQSPDLIRAFETSMIEIEILGKKLPTELPLDEQPVTNSDVYSVVNCHFVYRTTPSMNYTQDGQQKGPIHVGRMELEMRAYAWNEKQIENYRRYRIREDLELLGFIDGSLQAAVEALGSELEDYLKQAGEEFYEEKKGPLHEEPNLPGVLDPFVGIFKGFGEMGGAMAGNKKRPTKKDKHQLSQERKRAVKEGRTSIWQAYKEYKKAHGMLHWG